MFTVKASAASAVVRSSHDDWVYTLPVFKPYVATAIGSSCISPSIPAERVAVTLVTLHIAVNPVTIRIAVTPVSLRIAVTLVK